MATQLTWLGHSAFHLSGGGADVLIDPFLTGNPKAAASADRASSKERQYVGAFATTAVGGQGHLDFLLVGLILAARSFSWEPRR